MARKLIITTDHEIFGNGAGDVRQHVVRPTEAMGRIAERHGVPVTIFFELEEYLAFERHAVALRRELGYDPAAEMRKQAADLARRGHDLQLHLHPQWDGASWIDGGWQLDQETLTVDALFESAEETRDYLGRRKEALEALSGKPVVAYRAGGFAAQPAGKLLAAIAGKGFVIESSVVRGLHRSQPHPLDYRGAPDRARMWRIEEDVCREAPGGPLWEVPIHSEMGRRVHQLTARRLRAKFSRNVPKDQQQAMVGQLGVGRNPLKAARFLGERVPIKLDYHNLSPRALMKMIRSAPAPLNGEPDVLVLIGHSKEHIDDRSFETFVKAVAADPDLEVITFSDLAGELRKETCKGAEPCLCTAAGQ